MRFRKEACGEIKGLEEDFIVEAYHRSNVQNSPSLIVLAIQEVQEFKPFPHMTFERTLKTSACNAMLEFAAFLHFQGWRLSKTSWPLSPLSLNESLKVTTNKSSHYCRIRCGFCCEIQPRCDRNVAITFGFWGKVLGKNDHIIYG